MKRYSIGIALVLTLLPLGGCGGCGGSPHAVADAGFDASPLDATRSDATDAFDAAGDADGGAAIEAGARDGPADAPAENSPPGPCITRRDAGAPDAGPPVCVGSMFTGPNIVDPSLPQFGLAIADFNQDGAPDLADTTGGAGIDVVLGNGDGTFRPHTRYDAAPWAFGVTIGDFNEDRITDLVASETVAETVFTLLGNGDGTFRPGSTAPAPLVGYIAVADFNGDGHLDVATTNGDLLWGAGDGSFPSVSKFDPGSQADTIRVVDLDGDKVADLVVGSQLGYVSVLLGNGDGSFASRVQYPVAGRVAQLTLADFNGDGVVDFAVAGSVISILLGNGDGTFHAGAAVTKFVYPLNAAADLDNDGNLDLVTGSGHAMSLIVHLGNGDGTFRSTVPFDLTTNATGVVPVAAADLNCDGRLDLIVDTSDVTVLLNAGCEPETLNDGGPGMDSAADGAGDAAADVRDSGTGG